MPDDRSRFVRVVDGLATPSLKAKLPSRVHFVQRVECAQPISTRIRYVLPENAGVSFDTPRGPSKSIERIARLAPGLQLMEHRVRLVEDPGHPLDVVARVTIRQTIELPDATLGDSVVLYAQPPRRPPRPPKPPHGKRRRR